MQQRKQVRLASEEAKLVEEVLKHSVPEGVLVRENFRAISHSHTYGRISKFFQGISQGTLLGTYCPNCFRKKYGNASIWLPPRSDCPDCWSKMAWRSFYPTGAKIYSYSVTNYPGAGFKGTVPCPLISVEIPFVCTKMMSYLSEFYVKESGMPLVYVGMPVEPVFRTEKPTYTILDLSWAPPRSL